MFTSHSESFASRMQTMGNISCLHSRGHATRNLESNGTVTETTTEGNIGRSGQRQRLFVGIASLFVALVLLVVLQQSGAGRIWRLGAFPMFWMAGIGIFQARARTCVAFAARGMCELDDGRQVKAEDALAARFRARARGIMVQATIAAGVATAVGLLLP